MPKYVIERDIAGVGALSPDQLQQASAKSCAVLHDLGPRIQWLQSYVTENKLYCVYLAPSEELIRKHAEQSGFPAHRISRVHTIIGPETAE